MEFEAALYEWMAAQPALVALLQVPAGKFRAYHVVGLQKGRQPCVVIQRNTTATQQLYCGPDGTVGVRLMLDFYANDWATARLVAKVFKDTLVAVIKTGPVWMGGDPNDSPLVAVKVKGAQLDNLYDLPDPEPGLIRCSQAWTFWIVEG